MSKIISIKPKDYTPEELLKDVSKDTSELKDVILIAFDNNGIAGLTHTGLSLSELALAIKLIDVEFNRVYSEEYE